MKQLIIALALCLTFGFSVACASGHDAGKELFDKKCAKCHGADGAKTSGASGGTMLKGQSADEIKEKLLGYQDGSYGGKKKKTMERMVGKLDKNEIEQLSLYIGSF